MQHDGMKVGELARGTGISVRTLHHYHEIGLLVPSHHSPGEHRLYSAADVARLQQIKSLQGLGLSLEDVRCCLDQPDYSPLHTIEQHLERLGRQIEQQRRLCLRLERIADHLRSAEEVSVEDLVKAIEGIVMLDEYYTPEQLDELRVRREAVGEERIQAVQAEWMELFRLFEAAMDEGADPSSEPVLALARRAQGLIEEFTGGNPGIRESLATMYRQEGGPRVMEQHGFPVAPGVGDYMGRATEALGKGG